jgi:hypothetical protein
MRFRKLAALIFGALLVSGLAAGGFAWRNEHLRFERQKAEFLAKYDKLITKAIRYHFLTTGELPKTSREIDRIATRQSWVLDEVVRFGFNRPTLEEGWLNLEQDAVTRVFPACQARVEEWERELTNARRPLVEREGNPSAQLELFIDQDFEYLAGYRFLMDLQERRGVAEKSVREFIAAFLAVREAHSDGMRLRHAAAKYVPESWNAVAQKSDLQLAQALDAFERCKKGLLAEAEATKDFPREQD